MPEGVLVRYLMTLFDVMHAVYKVDVLTLSARAGVAPLENTNSADRVTTDYADKLWLAASGLADDALGMRVGAAVRYTSYASLGHLLVTCETVGDVLRVIADNAHYVGAGHFHLEEHEQEVRLEYQLDARHPVADQRAVASLLPFSTLAKSVAGGVLPSRIWLRMDKPENHALYEKYFGVPVSFNMSSNGAAWARAMLSKRMPDANAALNELLLRHLKTELGQQHTVSAKVKTVLQEILETGEAETFVSLNLDSCAKILEMPRRSLQRSLLAEGRKFRDLLGDLRAEKAEYMLRHSSCTVAEIAERLGYSEAASFVRAFKKSRKVSPLKFRALHGL